MKKVEYLIVGKGLAGTLLAFEMLQNDIDFKIVSSTEKSKASAVAAGMINPLVFKRLTKSWLLDDLLPVMKSTFRNLENKLNTQFLFEKDILKPLSEQEKKLWLERKANIEFSNYIKAVYDSSQINAIQNSAWFGLVTESGYLNLNEFLNASDKFLRSKNKLVDFTIDYKKLNPENTSFEVADFQADKIVFCEGFHITKNPFFQFVKMNPVKGEVLQIFAPELSEEFILNKQVFVLPVGNHRYKIGSTYEWKDLSDKTTETGKNSILERFEKLVSVDYSVENHWAGVRPTVVDRRPVLGIHPKYKRISVFNGLGTKGVMLAPYFAKEMIKVLTVPDYELNAETRVERFI